MWVNYSGASRTRFSCTLSFLPAPSSLLPMINYQSIKTREALSSNLCTTSSYLAQVVESPIHQYKVVKIPKRRGKGSRLLYIANDDLRSVQKIIRDDLTARSTWPECVQGFVKGTSIVTNAKLHLAKRFVLNIDIKDYYKSIDKAKVTQLFCSIGATPEIGELLAAVCTCDNYLVPGTVCAPVISNLVFADCDKDLVGIATQLGCAYSRYVDDLTFSGEKIPSIKEIDTVLKSHGFPRNPDKTYRQTRGRRQYVTGLTVFDPTIPRISKYKKREFRQSIYFMEKYGIEGHLSRIGSEESAIALIFRFNGLLNFYHSIEPHFVSKYWLKWEAITSNFYD